MEWLWAGFLVAVPLLSLAFLMLRWANKYLDQAKNLLFEAKEDEKKVQKLYLDVVDAIPNYQNQMASIRELVLSIVSEGEIQHEAAMSLLRRAGSKFEHGSSSCPTCKKFREARVFLSSL